MSFLVNISNSGGVDKSLIFGTTTDWKSFNLDLDTLSLEDKKICQDFLAVSGLFATVDIENITSQIEDCSFIVTSEVTTDINVVDFNSLSIEDKDKIESFCNLLVSNSQ